MVFIAKTDAADVPFGNRTTWIQPQKYELGGWSRDGHKNL